MSSHKTAVAAFVRPANTIAYAIGDIVANHVAAASITPNALRVSGVPGSGGRIQSILLAKSSVGIVNAQFRVHLFTRPPVVTSGDNVAMAVAGVAAGYVGHVDITVDKVFSDGATGDVSASLPYQLIDGGRDLYAVVEALAAYTPASAETVTVRLVVERD